MDVGRREWWIQLYVRYTAATMLIVGAMGCTGSGGLERAAVSGEVFVNGQPVDNGVISFIPIDQTKGPSAGGAIRDGRYSIQSVQGPVVGTHRVEIRATRSTGRRILSKLADGPSGPMVDETEQFIPTEYNTESTLTAVIKSGDNEETNFELKIH